MEYKINDLLLEIKAAGGCGAAKGEHAVCNRICAKACLHASIRQWKNENIPYQELERLITEQEREENGR